MKTRILALVVGALALLLVPTSALAAKTIRAGAAVVDGNYHVGTSAGQYSSTRDGGYGDFDPHLHSVKNQASYGFQARIKVRALVVEGADGNLVAIVSDNHYIAQDALFKRTAQLVEEQTGGKIGRHNLTMSVTHNHSSPSHSALAWGVWAFQDVFDFRFYDYYARQNAKAIVQAYENLRPARMGATVSYFDAFQRNPMGPEVGDTGTPVGFPRPYTDHDLSVVRFEDISDRKRPKPLATVVNLGMHPEMLEGYDLISGEWPEVMATKVDRSEGGVTLMTQNATGTSEVERDNWHDVNTRAIYDHAQYAQMEWGAHQLAEAVRDNVRDIEKGKPNGDRTEYFGMTSYRDRFVEWTSSFPVAIEDRWFPGPVSHPYPGVSSCRTDSALAGNPRVPVVGLPDCTEVPVASSLSPATGALPVSAPGVTTDDLEALGVPVPENYSAPSSGALQDSVGVHLQAFRLGDVLFTVCSCEQWVDQSYNIKTRTDTKIGNEYLGYDPTGKWAHPSMQCTKNGDGTYAEDGTGTGTWRCSTNGDEKLSDAAIQKMRAQINNDAAGWDDPLCMELGCGVQAESEPTDITKIRGNYTHDDTETSGPKADTKASQRGYKMVVTMAMANDYNGYIATYRDYMNHDHYRKALTGWGPHSSDYLATRMVRMGRALKGDDDSRTALDAETEPGAAPQYTALAAKEVADQAAQDAKVRAVGEVASAASKAYNASLPDDGGAEDDLVQPKDIERFDAATFTWNGGTNHIDNPVVKVQRRQGNRWVTFATDSFEVPVTLEYPGSGPQDVAAYRAGGQEWKWTASFEAFVARFSLVDARGRSYRATPAGEYRFSVRGVWRKGNKSERYKRVSNPFTVRPWSGITVEELGTDGDGHVTFAAGPTRTVQEQTVRKTDRAPLKPGNAPVAFTLGPVDYPDTLKDPAATGARFLNSLRGYSAASFEEVEHYCLDCRFRDWMDVTDELVAEVRFTDADGDVVTEEVEGDREGAFRTKRARRSGETVTVVIRDAWGNHSGAPKTL